MNKDGDRIRAAKRVTTSLCSIGGEKRKKASKKGRADRPINHPDEMVGQHEDCSVPTERSGKRLPALREAVMWFAGQARENERERE